MKVRGTDTMHPEVTAREREVLDLIRRGLTNAEIAERLGITFTTAKWHVSEVISKLGVRTREEAADVWRDYGRPGAQARRLVHGLVALPLGKLVMGGAVASVGVIGAGAIAFAVLTTLPADAALQVATETVEPTATPEPTLTLTPEPTPAFDERGCPASYSSSGPLCSPSVFQEFVDADKGGCDLSGAQFHYLPKIDFVDFSGCDLSGTFWAGPFANDSWFDGALMDGVTIEGGTAGYATFTGASLRGAVITGLMLQGADFTNADLTGARLTDGYLEEAIWTGATCPDGTLAEANGGTCVGTEGITLRAG